MKFKSYSPATIPVTSTRQGQASIGFAKTGVITLSGAAVSALKLKAGDQVQFHQDEDRPDEWYIEKVKDGGFELKGKEEAKQLTFSSAGLKKLIFDSMAYTGTTGRCLIAGKPTMVEKRELFAILTAGLRNK